MDFGIAYFPTHNAMGPDAMARLVEDRGYDSLFFSEHTHIPASRQTPYPRRSRYPRSMCGPTICSSP